MTKQALQLSQLQAKKLAQVGLQLCQVREQRGLSVEDISAKIHIPARLLRAIEAGDLDHLPEPVYIQSFIRQYANAIGVNGVHLASEFPLSPVVMSQRRRTLAQGRLNLSPMHLYAGYLCLIVAAVQGLSYVLNRSASQLPSTLQTLQGLKESLPAAQVSVGPEIRSQAEQIAGSAALPQQTQNPNKAVRVGLTVTDPSWVRVIVDGKPQFEEVLTQGTQRLVVANERVTIRAGNAGGVIATFNGGTAKPLGKPGTVEEVSFPPDSKLTAAMPTTIAQRDR
jgi:cytoskeletal protein RodZ